MGKVPAEKPENTSAHLVNPLPKRNSSITDLWKLEASDIMDSIETKSREQMERNSRDHFMKIVNRYDNGKYIVTLPWIEPKEILQDNRSIAEQRCIRASETLKDEGRYADYEAVFKEWLGQESIEKVSERETRNLSYYLPHKSPFKKDSEITISLVFDASCRV